VVIHLTNDVLRQVEAAAAASATTVAGYGRWAVVQQLRKDGFSLVPAPSAIEQRSVAAASE
jgi:hypothetical protein